MEIETKPSLPYFGFYRMAGNIFVPTMGAMLLLIVAVNFSRTTTGGINRIALLAITVGIAVIGIAYYNVRRELNRLDGKIGDKALSKLCHAATAMAMFGYLICIMATLLRH